MKIPRLKTSTAMADWHEPRHKIAMRKGDSGLALFHAAQAAMWLKRIDDFDDSLPVGYGPFEEGIES